jgi:hypothetical protein
LLVTLAAPKAMKPVGTWCTSVIPAVRKLRKENQDFEATLVYIGKPCFKKTK